VPVHLSVCLGVGRGLRRAALGNVTVLRRHLAQREGDLSLEPGDVVAVTSGEGAWWSGFTCG
jgi:hypothetical protein